MCERACNRASVCALNIFAVPFACMGVCAHIYARACLRMCVHDRACVSADRTDIMSTENRRVLEAHAGSVDDVGPASGVVVVNVDLKALLFAPVQHRRYAFGPYAEAGHLVGALHRSDGDAHALVEAVWRRASGSPLQVRRMVTLAAHIYLVKTLTLSIFQHMVSFSTRGDTWLNSATSNLAGKKKKPESKPRPTWTRMEGGVDGGFRR